MRRSGRSLSPMPAGTTLRVELLAERRGSELRADVTAEAETVHVRVWQDGVEALDRQFLRRRAATDVDLLAEAIEAGGRDHVADRARCGRRPALVRAEGQPGRDAGAGRTDGHRRLRWPTWPVSPPITSSGRSARLSMRRGIAHWATTGGSDPAEIYHALLRSGPCATRSTGTTVQVWWGDDRFVPRDHPLSNVRPFDEILLVTRRTRIRHPATSGLAIRFARVRSIGRGGDAARCAAELEDELRDARARDGGCLAGRSTWCSSVWAATATCCRCSPARRPSIRRSGRWPSRPRPTSSRTSSG